MFICLEEKKTQVVIARSLGCQGENRVLWKWSMLLSGEWPFKDKGMQLFSGPPHLHQNTYFHLDIFIHSACLSFISRRAAFLSFL